MLSVLHINYAHLFSAIFRCGVGLILWLVCPWPELALPQWTTRARLPTQSKLAPMQARWIRLQWGLSPGKSLKSGRVAQHRSWNAVCILIRFFTVAQKGHSIAHFVEDAFCKLAFYSTLHFSNFHVLNLACFLTCILLTLHFYKHNYFSKKQVFSILIIIILPVYIIAREFSRTHTLTAHTVLWQCCMHLWLSWSMNHFQLQLANPCIIIIK